MQMATEASSSQYHMKDMKPRPPSKRRGTGAGVKLSTDPQSIAARERRHRISNRFKILQSMVPGGTKMDTVSMLEKAIQYVKFLKTQIWLHQAMMKSPVQQDLLPSPPSPPPPPPSLSSPHVAFPPLLASTDNHQQFFGEVNLPPLPPSYFPQREEETSFFPACLPADYSL